MSTPSDKTLRLERTKLTPQPPRGGRNSAIIIAVVAGVIAAILTGVWLNNQKTVVVTQTPTAPAPAAPTQTPVIVATRDIPAQTVVTGDMVKLDKVDQDKVDPNVAVNPQQVIGQVVVLPIKAGEQVKTAQIQPNIQSRAGVAAMLKPPYRAMTIALDPVSSVNGFVKPGDHVDVIGTFSGQGRTITRTVLQNVYLIAAGSQVVYKDPQPQQQNSGGVLASNTDQPQPQVADAKPQEVPNATVMVTPIDAEKLIMASNKGKLMLILRSNVDAAQAVIPTIDETAVTTLKSAAAAQVAPPPPPPPAPSMPTFVSKPAPVVVPPPAPPSVTVIRGSDAHQVTVGI